MPVLVALPFAAIATALVAVASSQPSMRAGDPSLAGIRLPLGGGQIVRVVAIGGPEQHVVPVRLVGRQVVPTGALPPGESLTIQATIRRPSWISWLTGGRQQVQIRETTPVVRLTSDFLTRRAGRPVSLAFSGPVAVLGSGPVGRRVRARPLPRPVSRYDLNETTSAGTAKVLFAARRWETPTRATVSWFPAGTASTAVASPAPGTRITPDTRITLTFSKPVSAVLGAHLPPISPSTAGAWRALNSHTIEFVPQGYGYGLGAEVRVALPAGVRVAGAAAGSAQWTVPAGSTLALQELLARLGYLPVRFTPTGAAGAAVAPTPAAEEAAIVHPPQGRFSWRYPNTPARLRALFSAGSYNEITKGAVMAFEQDQGLATDGVAGVQVWRALINAAVKGQASTFGYTFVMVSEHAPETIHVWHNGRIVVHGLANTGIPASPTALGTFAVYEHIPVGTMSGTNPNGTPYHDPGIPWISYFNGGDALHGFIRASYGFPQSLGCVEMPFSEAGAVYPYTPIGTIVNVTA
ncbi:MAG TPA: peptidoglycan-binding protein [Solirubrobacteraceae bacterium]|nr:peptidoglycan-binding protein [Solirubrobacteraceae bacterium]